MNPCKDPTTVRQARAAYFAANGFGDDGGYSAKWVKLEMGGIPLAFPNTPARVRAVKLHDLHHVVTGYATTATGEAEIGAWEIASGCGHYVAAWMLNLWAFAYGLAIAPRALLRAFVRGRRSRNLYAGPGLDEALLEAPVAALRAELAVPPEPGEPPRPADLAWFGVWSLAAWLWMLASLAAVAAPFVLGARALL